jgi:outer membrane protein OmpA-like peptidoglycan-associated protein
MPGTLFYLWQVRSFKVRLSLDFIETLTLDLKDQPPEEEHGGLLLGRILDNDTVEVTGFEFIRSKHHRGAAYDLGGGERYSFEQHVRNLSRRGSPNPVGYFRTHLRPGLFLDQSDFALMNESFSDLPSIALTIGMDGPSPSNAGIFFWEDGDIDRGRTELMFPFNADALRVQGPVVQETCAPAIRGNVRAWAPEPKSSLTSVLWGTAFAILVFAVFSQFHRGSGRAREIENISVHPAAPAPAPNGGTRQSPLRQELQVVSRTPPESPSARIPLADAEPRPAGAEGNQGETGEGVAAAEAGARTIPTQSQSTVAGRGPETRKSELRSGLLEQLNGAVSIRDTARGLVATVPDSAFTGSELRTDVSGRLARLVAEVLAHPGLRIDVEGNSDSGAGEALSSQRAEAVRRSLVAQGLPNGIVTARGLGDAHRFGPNTSVEGREANRRVEIVISGDPIGDVPLWEHPYTLTPNP